MISLWVGWNEDGGKMFGHKRTQIEIKIQIVDLGRKKSKEKLNSAASVFDEFVWVNFLPFSSFRYRSEGKMNPNTLEGDCYLPILVGLKILWNWDEYSMENFLFISKKHHQLRGRTLFFNFLLLVVIMKLFFFLIHLKLLIIFLSAFSILDFFHIIQSTPSLQVRSLKHQWQMPLWQFLNTEVPIKHLRAFPSKQDFVCLTY